MYTQTQTTVDPININLYGFRIAPPSCVADRLHQVTYRNTSRRSRLILFLDRWHFEPHKLANEEVLFCAQFLFETLFRIQGMHRDTGVSLSQSFSL